MPHSSSKETEQHKSNHSTRYAHRSRRIGGALICYLALCSNVHAIVLGMVDVDNTYNSVGFVLASTDLTAVAGSVVALSPDWALTAAHVVEDVAAEGGTVILAMGDPNPGGVVAFHFFIDEIVIHENYDSGQFHDDLALIKVSAIDPINPGIVDVSFATLSNADLDSTSPGFLPLPGTARITGYGVTEIGVPPDPAADILRRYGDAATDSVAPTPPIVPFDCSHASLLCTYGTTGGAPGDSGGAMLLDYGGDEVVAGINSFIFDENDLLDPVQPPNWDDGYWTVATSTAYYEDWITSHVPTAMFGAPVPLPPAIYLFAAGLLGVLGMNRRRPRPHEEEITGQSPLTS